MLFPPRSRQAACPRAATTITTSYTHECVLIGFAQLSSRPEPLLQPTRLRPPAHTARAERPQRPTQRHPPDASSELWRMVTANKCTAANGGRRGSGLATDIERDLIGRPERPTFMCNTGSTRRGASDLRQRGVGVGKLGARRFELYQLLLQPCSERLHFARKAADFALEILYLFLEIGCLGVRLLLVLLNT
eukprot:scaffold62053_cov32-Tisochrysis_lutea.AAC.2